MKRIILILISLLFLSSCNTLYKLTPAYWQLKSEFKKELEFVQKILDNPDKMQEIIETSEFYDKNNFYMCGNSYDYFKNYINHDSNAEVKIAGFGWVNTNLGSRGQNKYENVKSIDVYKNEQNFEVHFAFLESGNKTILVEICTVTK